MPLDLSVIGNERLLMETRRSLERFTPDHLQDVSICEESLLCKVWGRNRRGQHRNIKAEEDDDTMHPLALSMDIPDIDERHLLMETKRSLERLTPDYLQNVSVFEDTLLCKVWETNRRGEEKLITKIVCPFCSSTIAPQYQSKGRRWYVTNFNKHLRKHSKNRCSSAF
ncbi:hypothetical protein Bhyg_09203 [Pseudolycoriella hygida]|uniref:Uncharacterized protein n=1 Tax=Pseudolycoriella hygida TaxID=35572 RepID=A0A9Q0N616_9DIPT|nr:hypothetical protein Bhyg_09203 [Pseudolycoriella hygida]